jgi:light-regulated signal transduction histidine kinase (bacteriophytochrome)
MEVRMRVRGGERIEHYETQRLTRDGRCIDVSLAVSPIRGEDGGTAGLSFVARDVSERRAVDRELARSHEDLEQFAYVVSHDLSEPLRAITGFLGLLSRRHGPELDADGQRYVRRSIEGAERMRHLIDDLLAYSRAGRAKPVFGRVEIAEVVATALETLDAGLGGDDVHVAVHHPLPVVHGNAGQLVQVLQNLLGNALKFRRPEAVRIEVRAERIGGEWRLSVLDDGIGIDARYADRVFLVFKRLHSREAYTGTGIGLAICKRIVESHDGRIWWEARDGGGTAFHLTLPSAEERA